MSPFDHPLPGLELVSLEFGAALLVVASVSLAMAAVSPFVFDVVVFVVDFASNTNASARTTTGAAHRR